MKNHHTSVALTHQVDFTPRMTLTTTAYRNDFSRVWHRVDNIAAPTPSTCSTTLRHPPAPTPPDRDSYLRVLRGQTTFADAIGNSGAKVVNASNGRDFVSEGIQTCSAGTSTPASSPIASRLAYASTTTASSDVTRRTSTELYERRALPRRSAARRVTTFNKAATYALAPHVQYALTFQSLTVTPGLRTELMRMSFVDRATGDGFKFNAYAVLPGIGLYYALTEELGLLAGVYRGFSAPPPDAGKGAQPEYSINYEAGTRYTKGPLRAEVDRLLQRLQQPDQYLHRLGRRLLHA